MRASIASGLVMALLLILVGCSSPSANGTFDLAEWDVSGPTRLSPDTGSVDVVNSGSLPHTLVVTDSSGQVVAATDLIGPGSSATLALDLEPGSYSFTCRIVAQNPEGELVDHFEAGMNTLVSVDR